MRIVIPVDKPVASPRPRFARRGGFVKTYMPSEYTDHKEYIKSLVPKEMSEDILSVSITFVYPVLKSWSKKKQAEMIGKPRDKKPDMDNLFKTVLDACNNHLWKDDGQVAKLSGSKIYGEIPCVILEVERYEV